MTSPELHIPTWWELPVPDLAAAQTFYGTVFGWTFEPFGEAYVAVRAGEAMIGGLDGTADRTGQGVRVYFNVADLDATLAKVRSAGGAVAAKPQEVGGGMGYWAAFTDPDGLWIGITSAQAPAS